MLMTKMSDVDKRVYNFNVNDIVWEDYYPNYFRGNSLIKFLAYLDEKSSFYQVVFLSIRCITTFCLERD